MMEKEKDRKRGPAYRSDPIAYRDAIARLAADGYREVVTGLYTESLEAHLRRLDEGPEAQREQLVRLEPAGEALEEADGPSAAPPPEEVDFPPVVDVLRVQEAGGREYVDETPFALVRRHPQEV